MKMDEGFRSTYEMENYLKAGGVVGDFFGKEGEEDHTNRFIAYDKNKDEYLYRREVYEDFSMEGTMNTKWMSSTEFIEWMTSLENHKDANCELSSVLFHKNEDCHFYDVMEFV